MRLGDVIRRAEVRRCGDADYPVLSMTMHDGIVLQEERFKKEIAGKDKSQYKIVSPNQLVIGFPIDEGVLYVQNFDFEGIMSPAYNVWDIDTSVVEPTYLELALHSPQSMQFYAGKLRGTTARRRSIPAETLLEMPIPVPSRAEQCKVATALGLARHQIQERQVMTAMLDELVKSRFVEMFGDPAIPSARMSKLVIYARNGVSPSKIGEHREKVLTLSAITQGAFDAAAWK